MDPGCWVDCAEEWHIPRKLQISEYTRRTWSSYMHLTVIRMWLNLRPQKIIYTRVHRNCESGLVIIYKHAAHRLVLHRLQVVEMEWTGDSTLANFF